MLFDTQNEFCDATSVAASAGTALVGNVIDLGLAGPDLGAGEPVYWYIGVDTGIITGGSAGTVQFLLVSDSTASISTTTSTVHLETPVYVTGASSLPAKTVIFFGAIPMGLLAVGSTDAEAGENTATYQQYLGVLCVTGTTTTTAGKINSMLTKNSSGWRANPDASN